MFAEAIIENGEWCITFPKTVDADTSGSQMKIYTDEKEVVFNDGFIKIPDKPGLGIDVNIDEVLARPYTPRNLRHYTGAVTDIRPKDDTIYYFKGLENEKYE